MIVRGARWPSGLERCTGDRVVLGSNPAPFGGDINSRRSYLSGIYARGNKRSHQSALEMCNLSWTPPLLDKDNSKNNPV